MIIRFYFKRFLLNALLPIFAKFPSVVVNLFNVREVQKTVNVNIGGEEVIEKTLLLKISDVM